MRRFLLIVSALALVGGCAEEPETAPDTMATPAPVAEERTPQPIANGLQTPESVLHDPDQDVYFISNINGSPLETDDNGFISRVAAESGNVELKWIDGAAENVQLDAPKGMAIVGDELWVTDITRVRRFDRRTGEPRGEIAIQGAGFLNDLTASGTTAWVSDSGLRAGASGFEPSGTDAVYRIDANGSPQRIASGDMLNRPNGLYADGDAVWVVTFGAAELYRLDNGQKAEVTTLPAASLDGVVRLSGGDFLVSSWDGSAVYRGRPGGTFTAVVENADAPADIGWDSKRNLLLVPHFNENQVTFHPIE